MNPALEIGKTIGGGRYIVEQVLGIGGFGITYYVRHIELGAHYAVKEFFISGKCVRESDRSTVLLQNIDQSRYAKLKKRFADEARTLVALNNPHVVRVIDIFEENNTSYIVMEYVPGITLQQKVEQEGVMSFEDAVNCMGQLAEAVSYIHEKHILHRDIKPDNVIATPDNRIVLIDFGSAREFVHDEVQNQTAILTQGYAPIEQYNTTSKKGNYTDIYALGGVFYFILTGVKPIDAAARLSEPLQDPIILNPKVPKTVSNTIMKAMELKPEDRYQNVEEFMIDLLGGPVASEEILNNLPEKTRKRMPLLWLLLSISALIITGIVLFFSFVKESDEHEYARLQQVNYQELVNICQENIDNGSSSDYRQLFRAKDQLVEIEKLEKECESYYPEVYNKSSELLYELEKKMKTASEEWEQSAIAQMGIDERGKALSYFILAGKLNPQMNSVIFQELADSLAFMRITNMFVYEKDAGQMASEIQYEGFYLSEQHATIVLKLYDSNNYALKVYDFPDLLIVNKPEQCLKVDFSDYPNCRVDHIEVWHNGHLLYNQKLE